MDELDRVYELRCEQITSYREHGHLKLPRVLSRQTIGRYGPELTRVTRAWSLADFLAEYDAEREPGREERPRARASSDTYARAFTQRVNLWRQSPAIERFVRSRRLARIAAELMGTAGVRIYHDQALYKEPHGGHTPWHCDQFYWPLANDNTITVWIPLQAVPLAMGPVAFARGSHRYTGGEVREFAISDESETRLSERMADFQMDESPFELGDVSFHSGWTCHRAGENHTDEVRAAFTIIYMDRDVRMLEPRHAAHRLDARMWLPGVRPGETAASRLNPILYEA